MPTLPPPEPDQTGPLCSPLDERRRARAFGLARELYELGPRGRAGLEDEHGPATLRAALALGLVRLGVTDDLVRLSPELRAAWWAWQGQRAG